MDPLSQIRLRPLMSISSGHPDIVIGVIDGPIDFSHFAFRESRIRTVKYSQRIACNNASSIACKHGTFITGILFSKRGLSSPAICPDCQMILHPIFAEDMNNPANDRYYPRITPEKLADAIIEMVDAGARVINLSLALSTSSLINYQSLYDAYSYALKKHVIIVAAAGNQGKIGNVSLIDHPWVIPVASCNESGQLDQMSNFGPSIGNRGLLAPGVNITSTSPGGQFSNMSGTSFAAAFVAGAIALLCSIFTNASSESIMYSLIKNTSSNRRSVIPPLPDTEAAWKFLKSIQRE
jgi:subtilisin family serine protease